MSDPSDPAERPLALARWLWRRRRARLAASAVLGTVAAVLVAVFGNWIYAPAIGWDVTALAFTGITYVAVWQLSAEQTAQ